MKAAVPKPNNPLRIVVMGVSGAGKSSVGSALAARLGLRFVDGDALHAPESIAKLRRGVALDDGDRWPWLDRVAACLVDATATAPGGTLVACSALKRAHRDRLRARVFGLRFLFLDVPVAVLRARVAARVGHPMPASLLSDQLRTLEPPGDDEADVCRLAASGDAEATASAAARLVSGAIGGFQGGTAHEAAHNPQRSTTTTTPTSTSTSTSIAIDAARSSSPPP